MTAWIDQHCVSYLYVLMSYGLTTDFSKKDWKRRSRLNGRANFFYSETENVGYSEDKSWAWKPNHNLLTRLQPHLSRVFTSKNDNVFLESPPHHHPNNTTHTDTLPLMNSSNWRGLLQQIFTVMQSFSLRGAKATWGTIQLYRGFMWLKEMSRTPEEFITLN